MARAPLPDSPNEETAGTSCGHEAAVPLCHEVDTCVPGEVEMEYAVGNGTEVGVAGGESAVVARYEQEAASDEAAAESSELGVAASGETGVAPVELRGARDGAGDGGGGHGACAPSRCRTTAV
ncbi:hypothetical protein E2562_024936 [Oryza meyeriana var. granulata]|uniref:DUF834 domain-containing protein n=1 Tax=Oryza meyeriana var. granulata TaxID=110450 RepID=A0A6G1DP38_9ORYZ|nr:hypothetical protein E2562_024936 [Oryza meyeriana var. granulata]